MSLDELDQCVGTEDDRDSAMIGESISRFLRTQPKETRSVFVCRYFYCDSIAEIARRFGMSEGKVKTLLFRTRNRLKIHLEGEGITV